MEGGLLASQWARTQPVTMAPATPYQAAAATAAAAAASPPHVARSLSPFRSPPLPLLVFLRRSANSPHCRLRARTARRLLRTQRMPNCNLHTPLRCRGRTSQCMTRSRPLPRPKAASGTPLSHTHGTQRRSCFAPLQPKPRPPRRHGRAPLYLPRCCAAGPASAWPLWPWHQGRHTRGAQARERRRRSSRAMHPARCSRGTCLRGTGIWTTWQLPVASHGSLGTCPARQCCSSSWLRQRRSGVGLTRRTLRSPPSGVGACQVGRRAA